MERNDEVQSTEVDWCSMGRGCSRPEETTDMNAGKSRGGNQKGRRWQNFSMLSLKRVGGDIRETEGEAEQR